MMNETLCLMTTLHFENASIIIIVPNYFRYLCKTFAIIKWCAQLGGSRSICPYQIDLFLLIPSLS